MKQKKKIQLLTKDKHFFLSHIGVQGHAAPGWYESSAPQSP